ncbi:MAG: SEC-C metal-binding domain-containing protein, partial [Gemmatimonadota bacterium]|nr:SEC-C metal-binding domain-containing protein [Gemmatimonadota bacterium]
MPSPHRNDPCPCGSGKKFKRCHGQSAGGFHPGLSVADGGLTQDSFGPSPTPRREARWEVDLLPL